MRTYSFPTYDPASRLSTPDIAELLTNQPALCHFVITSADPHGWQMLAAWAGGARLTWRQTLRVTKILRDVFECSSASDPEQDAAAHSFDDHGDDRRLRSGRGGDTYRLLQQARVLTGRERPAKVLHLPEGF